MVDVKLLLEFAAVARTLSFTQAARELGVAQPWLSARVRKLEERLDMRLLTRSTRRVELTPDGHRLLELVTPLAGAAAEVAEALTEWRGGGGATLRIGCPQLGEPDARQADLLSLFGAAYPRIALEVEPGSAERHADLIARGAMDLMLSVRAEPPPGWEWLRIHPLTFAVMMQADDPLAEAEPLRVGAFAGRRLAVISGRTGPLHSSIFGPLMDAGAIPVAVPELRRSLLRDSRDLIVSTIVPLPGDAVLRHGIVRRTIDDLPALWLMLLRPRGIAMSRAAARFWQFAADKSGMKAGAEKA